MGKETFFSQYTFDKEQDTQIDIFSNQYTETTLLVLGPMPQNTTKPLVEGMLLISLGVHVYFYRIF